MIDLIRTQQLDIMLSLGSMCAIISFFIVMTGMNTKKKKAMFILELSAAVLLISARLTWIYNGMPDNFSKVMSAISNFLDFICVPIVIFGFNMYIKEMLSEAEGPGQNPMSFRIIDILLALDSICICLSPFTGLCYFLDENNVYNRGPAVSVCFAVPLIILLIQIFLILRHYKKLSHRTRLPVLLFVIVPFPAAVLQFCFYGLETTNIAIVAMAILLYLFDLSDINKSAEMSARAIAANEAKSSFLSNMSHEIRTPINAILGMNEMVLRESDDPKVLSYSENIKSAGSSLLGIVNDILDISKIEAGRINLIPVDYDLSDLIYDLVNIIDTRAETKGLDFRVDLDPSLPKLLNGDEVRIRQIIINILTNAVKYTEKGFVIFKISCEEKRRDPDRVLIKVAVIDSGIGIKKEDMDKLFIKFERFDEKRNRNIEGTGLGMTITKNLLEMMGSELKVESEYGKGSTFYFLLEQEVISWDDIGDYNRLYSEHQRKHSKYKEILKAPDARILVVDDYPMNLEVFRGLVKETLIQVDTAENGSKGLKYVAEKKYDMIFLDHMMPGKDGIETLKELRAHKDNPNADVPVICLTANALYGAREEYIAAGFDNYMTKPVDPEMLEVMLIKYLPKDKVSIGFGEGKAGLAEQNLKIVKMFYDSLDDRIPEINDLYSRRDIENYVIKVHALKTGFRTVGALDLGEEAQALELAGKKGNIEFIDLHHDEFLEKIESFKETLSNVCDEEEAPEQEKERIIADKKMLDRIFHEIRMAAEDMDCDRIDGVFAIMKNYSIPKEYEEIYKKLIVASENYEYKEIISIIDGEYRE